LKKSVREPIQVLVPSTLHLVTAPLVQGLNEAFLVCSDTADGLDLPHRQIVQHEISHNFGASDQGWYSWEHPECIMNYIWTYMGTTIWCTSCKNTVNYGLFH
jgi:hypothetical protein